MISGLDLNATIPFSIDTDKEPKTVFKLSVLPSYLYSRIMSEEGIEKVYKLFQFSVKGWENFNIDFTSEKIKLYGREVEGIPSSLLDKIPNSVIARVSAECFKLNELSEEERKN